MNQSLKIAILALVVAVGSASAQQYSATALSVSNSLGAYTTNTTQNGLLTLTKWDSVTIVCSGKLSGAGTAPITLTGYASGDGTTLATDQALVTITLTPRGTLTFCSVTNLGASTIGSIGYIKFTELANGNNATLSNFSVNAYTKPLRTGN